MVSLVIGSYVECLCNLALEWFLGRGNKRRAIELAKESAGGSFMTSVIAFVVLAVVVVVIFYGIAYFRTN